MVIEVVVGEIGKNGDLEGNTESTKLGEGVRGDFEDEKFGATIGDFTDATVESKSIYGGHVTELGLEFIYAVGDGGHEAGFVASLI